jgi:hypothetical protein
MDLRVDVRIRFPGRRQALRRCSIVQIRYLPQMVGLGGNELLDDIHNHCTMVRRKGCACARAGKGDLGGMQAVGTYINKAGLKVQYKTSSRYDAIPFLSKAVQVASVTIPGVLRVAQDLKNDSQMTAFEGMDGNGGVLCHVSHTMDLTINLTNSSHYDVNDGSHGFSVWTDDQPGTTKEWYFVLPVREISRN